MVILYTKLFDETLEYAVSELSAYIQRMSNHTVIPTAQHKFEMPRENVEGTIRLGLLSEFGLCEDGADDPYVDDVIDIDITGLTGYIAGSNIRSILLGVYRFLNSAGARWVRPSIFPAAISLSTASSTATRLPTASEANVSRVLSALKTYVIPLSGCLE